MSERRPALFGSWFRSVERLRDATPDDATIDIVMLSPAGRDLAVLSGAVLQPRDCRFFDGWDAWKRRERADFLHDDRAANAAPGPPPGPAAFVIAIDPGAREPVSVVRGAQ